MKLYGRTWEKNNQKSLEKKVSQMRRDVFPKIIPYMKRTNLKLTVIGITLRVLSRTEGAYPNPKEKPESLTWKSPDPPAPCCSTMRRNLPKGDEDETVRAL